MAEPKKIIKFTRDYLVQDEHAGTDKETRYKKGLRKSFPESSAKHFVDRGVAVYVTKGAKG